MTTTTAPREPATVVLDSDRRRTMMAHIAWRELQVLSESLHDLGWPMLREDAEEKLDEAWYYATMIGEWGKCLTVAQDPESASVTLPADTESLRERIDEFIRGVYENDLHEAELDEMQGLLDHVGDAKAFLDQLGGPVERRRSVKPQRDELAALRACRERGDA
jgi:hypothetical protein